MASKCDEIGESLCIGWVGGSMESLCIGEFLPPLCLKQPALIDAIQLGKMLGFIIVRGA